MYAHKHTYIISAPLVVEKTSTEHKITKPSELNRMYYFINKSFGILAKAIG